MMRAVWLLSLFVAVSVQAQSARVVAYGELPADTRDARGDTIGGIGSGIAYDRKTGLYYCVSDRGPGDGTLPYSPRIVSLQVIQEGEKLQVTLVKSTILRDEEGNPMTGLIPSAEGAHHPKMEDGRTSIDPEAIALAEDGTIYLSDEYGPYIYQFGRDGKMIRRIAFPDMFTPVTKKGEKDFTADAKLVSGRNINQGGEGMSISPDGKTISAIFQSGLVQDGGHTSPTTRLIVLDLETGKPVASYEYPFAKSVPSTGKKLGIRDLSVNDLISLGGSKYLVLERDGFGRDGALKHKKAKLKSVWYADASGATNLLENHDEPVPMKKTLLFNLPDIAPDPEKLAAKWEGICLVPPSAGRHLTIMMSADNDFLTPVIHEDGKSYPFPRTKDSVPTQFFKIRADLPENP
jgi:hypothetical protein